MSNQNSGIDIVIVGGGPVGLWTASQIKLLNPELNVIILEKHEKYQRSHYAFLDHKSFDHRVEHVVLQKLKESLKLDKKIKTNVLEETLLELCEDLDVGRITGWSVENASDLEHEFQGVKLIIGADGAHSTVRKTLCAGILESQHLRYSKHFHTLMEVKYEAIGDVKPMSMVNIGYPFMKHIGNVVNEVIGKKNEEGNTSITLQFFVNEEIGNLIKEATFKNPILFNERKEHLPGEIRDPIERWMAARLQYCEEKHIPSSIKITSTSLGSYASKYYVSDIGTSATYCLVGDAAFGMPFFRSLNNGILCGTKLAECVVRHFRGDNSKSLLGFSLTNMYSSVVNGSRQLLGFENPYNGKNISQPLIDYANFVQNLEGQQLAYAQTKSLSLNSFQTFTKISSLVPWQVNKLSAEQVQEIEKAREIFNSDNKIVYEEEVDGGFVLIDDHKRL